ncbi:hypothetical protein MZE56_024180 [Rahnella perminowiae]|nr:hypothetical protein [Rahnella perminowiae]MCR9003093.1 hypothetical protein [Rahnella perminowiae]
MTCCELLVKQELSLAQGVGLLSTPLLEPVFAVLALAHSWRKMTACGQRSVLILLVFPMSHWICRAWPVPCAARRILSAKLSTTYGNVVTGWLFLSVIPVAVQAAGCILLPVSAGSLGWTANLLLCSLVRCHLPRHTQCRIKCQYPDGNRIAGDRTGGKDLVERNISV